MRCSQNRWREKREHAPPPLARENAAQVFLNLVYRLMINPVID
jgi:hypothetical protein